MAAKVVAPVETPVVARPSAAEVAERVEGRVAQVGPITAPTATAPQGQRPSVPVAPARVTPRVERPGKPVRPTLGLAHAVTAVGTGRVAVLVGASPRPPTPRDIRRDKTTTRQVAPHIVPPAIGLAAAVEVRLGRNGPATEVVVVAGAGTGLAAYVLPAPATPVTVAIVGRPQDTREGRQRLRPPPANGALPFPSRARVFLPPGVVVPPGRVAVGLVPVEGKVTRPRPVAVADTTATVPSETADILPPTEVVRRTRLEVVPPVVETPGLETTPVLAGTVFPVETVGPVHVANVVGLAIGRRAEGPKVVRGQVAATLPVTDAVLDIRDKDGEDDLRPVGRPGTAMPRAVAVLARRVPPRRLEGHGQGITDLGQTGRGQTSVTPTRQPDGPQDPTPTSQLPRDADLPVYLRRRPSLKHLVRVG